MKKLFLSLLIVTIVVALSPLVGNRVAKNILDDKMSLLTSNGLALQDAKTDSSYLKTKKHYKIVLIDSAKFITYINKHTDAPLPPYINELLNKTALGLDIEYSNIPFLSELAIDIYPLSLSDKISTQLEKENPKFYKHIQKMLEDKKISYHINYDISDKSFDGYLKDIDEEYKFENTNELKFKLIGLSYSGDGSLIAPENLNLELKTLNFYANSKYEEISFKLNDMHLDSSYELKNSYASTLEVGSLSAKVKNVRTGDMEFDFKGIDTEMASDTQGLKAEVISRVFVDEFSIKSKVSTIRVTKLNYDISVSEMDKDIFDVIHEVVTKLDANGIQKYRLPSLISKLIARGLRIDIYDISMESIAQNDKSPIDGFTIHADIVVKEDRAHKNGMNFSSQKLLDMTELNSQMSFSKEFYKLFVTKLPIYNTIHQYEKEDVDGIFFDISLKDAQMKINDTVVR